MLLTKEQNFRLFSFLSTLINDDTEIKYLGIQGDNILIRAEPIKGEIENRVWRITPEGELVDSPSFFHE